MNIRCLAATVASTALFISAHALPQKVDKSEKIKSTKHVTGKLIAFELGDYVHAVVKGSNGKENSYYLGGADVEYFLAANARKTVRLTIQTVETYVEEAGQRLTMDRITAASLGKLTAKSWWAKQTAGRKAETVALKYEKLVETLAKRSGKAMRFWNQSAPVMVALNGWVFGVRNGSRWSEPGKDLAGKSARFLTFRGIRSTGVKAWPVEYDEEGPLPMVSLKGAESTEPTTLAVSGGNVRFATIRRVDRQDRALLAMARGFAATKGRSGLPVKIQDGLMTDLNGDGQPETIFAVGSGANEVTKKARDYAVLLISTKIGGKRRLLSFGFASDYGLQRGPFTYEIVGAGTFGGGPMLLAVYQRDAWGDVASLLQLTRDGQLKQVWAGGRGE